MHDAHSHAILIIGIKIWKEVNVPINCSKNRMTELKNVSPTGDEDIEMVKLCGWQVYPIRTT